MTKLATYGTMAETWNPRGVKSPTVLRRRQDPQLKVVWALQPQQFHFPSTLLLFSSMRPFLIVNHLLNLHRYIDHLVVQRMA